jgi:hypothetical protein
LLLLSAICTGAIPRFASAKIYCRSFDAHGVQMCEAGIDSRISEVTAMSVGGQHQTQWCWAACIEIIFRYYGFLVPQEQIVEEAWGALVNFPGQPGQILAELNRSWIDANGRQFSSSGDAFSANAVTAAQDLSQDMPLIIGTLGHAMVLTSLQYTRDQFGNGSVTAAIVRDPWPGRGRRILSAQEWFGANFLARIRVYIT